jgi:hypothetical protein
MKYLLEMPHRVLMGEAKGIEKWCKENNKAVPTLLDLGLARREVRKASRRGKGRRK